MEKSVVSPINDQEFQQLVSHYSNSQNGIQWTYFVDSIDRVFGPKQADPHISQSSHYPDRSLMALERPKSPKSQAIFAEIIVRLKSFVKHHGSDVKSWFKDFDQHNTGYITKSQFFRGFPPNLLSEDEAQILLSQYAGETGNTVNYLKMNTDVNRKSPRNRQIVNSIGSGQPVWQQNRNKYIPVGTEDLLHSSIRAPVTALTSVQDRIKKIVYKDRIRLSEFFKDYDRHNCGLVTVTQFRAGLKQANLLHNIQTPEVTALIKEYTDPSNPTRIQYRRFSTDIDSIFTIANLEAQPLAVVSPPPREFLVQDGATKQGRLTDTENARCRQVLARFKTKIAERRPLLAPYFKDFDKNHLGNMGKVTKSHFSRLLSTMKLEISEADLYILFKKYDDQGRIDYREFIADVDPLVAPIQAPTAALAKSPTKLPQTFPQILKALRYKVQTHRIRVGEYFKDFDKLRSYNITIDEFIRGVNRIGLDLSDTEYNILADHYKSSTKSDCVVWKDFENDIQLVFGFSNLESRPDVRPQPLIVQETPFVIGGEPGINVLTPKENQLLEVTLDQMREHLKIRQSSIKPFFRDFDKLCSGPRGYVTRSEFRQCLTYAQCNVTDEEFAVLAKKWTRDGSDGLICYLLFLKALEEPGGANSNETELVYDYRQFIKDNSSRVLSTRDFEKLLNRIKTRIKTQRIRIIDFMKDFDLLKHGKISKNEFRRGLNVVLINLTEVELASLEKMYESPTNPSMVDYVRFSDEIESVFTIKGLEKLPTTEPPVFKNYVYESGSTPFKPVVPSAEPVLVAILNRLSEKIHQRRLDLLSYLEDFDFVNEGTITTNQFRSALGTVGLVVDDAEIIALSQRYGTTKNKDRINYRAFASSLALAKSLDNIGTRANRITVAAHSLW